MLKFVEDASRSSRFHSGPAVGGTARVWPAARRPIALLAWLAGATPTAFHPTGGADFALPAI